MKLALASVLVFSLALTVFASQSEQDEKDVSQQDQRSVRAAVGVKEALGSQGGVSRRTRNAGPDKERRKKKGGKKRKAKKGKKRGGKKRASKGKQKKRKTGKGKKRKHRSGKRKRTKGKKKTGKAKFKSGNAKGRRLKQGGSRASSTRQGGAVYTGSACEYVSVTRLQASGSGCLHGTKFVIKPGTGTRRQFLNMDGEAIIGFVQQGTKFADCATNGGFKDVTGSINCKEVDGLAVAHLNQTGSGGSATTAGPGGSTTAGCCRSINRIRSNITNKQQLPPQHEIPPKVIMVAASSAVGNIQAAVGGLGPSISKEEMKLGCQKALEWPPLTPEQKAWAETHESLRTPPNKRQSTSIPIKAWPNNNVPYTIEAAFTSDQRLVIAAAIAEIEDNTCITFTAKTDSDEDWMHIRTLQADGCSAFLGYNGPNLGEHTLSLMSPGCIFKEVVVHEIMHILGFIHEHNRVDRDQFVTIDWTNLQLDLAFSHWRHSFITETNIKQCTTEGQNQATANFDDCRSGYIVEDLNKPYDISSVMHYRFTSFPVDPNKPTMTPKDPKVLEGGNLKGITLLDKQKLNTFYKCTQNDCGENVFVQTTFTFPATSSSFCEFALSADPDEIIQLDLSITFNGDCSTNYLELRSGTTLDGSLVDTFCRDNPVPAGLRTPTHQAYMKWISSGSGSSLEGKATAVENKCCQRINLTSSNQEVLSTYPFFGPWKETTLSNYSGKVYTDEDSENFCLWTINGFFLISLCDTVGLNQGYAFSTETICPEGALDWQVFISNNPILDNTFRFSCLTGECICP